MIDWIYSEDDIILTETEAKAIEAILASDCRDPVKTVLEAGYNPSSFFEHGNWEGIDFRRSQVEGISFECAILTSAIFNRSQFDIVSKTNPRTTDKVRIYEEYGSEDEPHVSIIQERPLDSGEAAKDFRDELKKIAEAGGFKKESWSILTALVGRLTPPRGRRWALNLLLEDYSAQPPQSFIDFCALEKRYISKYETTADRYISLSTIVDNNEKIKYIQDIYNSGNFDYIYLKKLASSIDEINEVGDFIEFSRKNRFNFDVATIGTLANRACKNIEDVRAFLRMLEGAQSKPNATFFSRLTRAIKSIGDVRDFLEMMKEAGVKPDTSVFSGLTSGSKSMDDVRAYLEMMREAGHKPDTSVFSELSKSSKSMDDVRDFLEMMKEAGVKPDTSVFSELSKSSKSMDDVRDFLELMKKAGVKPDTSVFSELTRGSKSMDDVRDFLELMKKARAKPDTTVFANFALRGKSMDEVRDFLEMMKEAGVKPDKTVFSNLAQRSKSMDDVRDFLELMKEARAKPDTTVFANFALRGKSMDEVRDFLEMMKEAGVKPDKTVFSNLAQRSKSMDDVRVFLELMKEAGVRPDGRHYRTFIGCCRSVDEAQAFLNAIDEEDGKQSISSFDRMLSNSESADKAEEILDIYAKYGLTPSHTSFNIFLRKIDPWERAWDAYRTRRPKRVFPTIDTLNPLFFKSCNRAQLNTVIDEMTKRRITADVFSLSSILGSALSDQDVIWALTKLEAVGFDISQIQLEKLGEQAERFRRITSKT
ncbi:hypothetical protein [Ciceribacter selenitireducens]